MLVKICEDSNEIQLECLISISLPAFYTIAFNRDKFRQSKEDRSMMMV